MREAKTSRTIRARVLSQNSTDAEIRLWHHLRSRALGNFKFVRQVPIGRYVADFVCREQRLIIELDGGQHATDPRDVLRDRWLAEHRYIVLRFWNNDVLSNTDGVLETILSALTAATPPRPASSQALADLSPQAGRGKPCPPPLLT